MNSSKPKNLYGSGLAVAEDLTRLKHQAALLFDTQTAIFDALEGISLEGEKPAGRLLDVGTGAGSTYQNYKPTSSLPELAQQCGFVVHHTANNRVFSRGSEQLGAPEYADVILENDVFASLFDFIGHREALAADYKAAKQDCLATQALMGIEIQTQVYRRLDGLGVK